MKQILLLLSIFFAVSVNVNAQKKIIVTGGGGGIDSVTIYERTDSVFYDFGDGERFAFKVSNVDTTGAFVTSVEELNDSTAVAWKGGVPELITLKGVQDLQSVTDRDSVTTRKVTVRNFNISGIPEFENNESAIENGLIKGDVYRLPYDTVKKAYLLAITDLPPPSPSLLLRILTNDGGSSLPFYDSASFSGYFISDNPSLNVTSYELVGDELTVIGTGFESIKEIAFASDTSIVEVESETATTIKGRAFKDCTSLTDISFPSAKTIEYKAFINCMALTEVNLTNFPAVTYWGDNALYGCASLTLFETNATTVRPGIFDYCGSLEEVKLNNATALFNIFGAYGAYNRAVPMLFRMPNLNNFIDDPFGVLIGMGVIDSGTDFTIEIPSAMTGNARILEVQAVGATIVGL